jgi:hypothetical protein
MGWLTIKRQIKGFFLDVKYKIKTINSEKFFGKKKVLLAKIIKKIHQLRYQFKVFCMQVIECNLDQHMKIRDKYSWNKNKIDTK